MTKNGFDTEELEDSYIISSRLYRKDDEGDNDRDADWRHEERPTREEDNADRIGNEASLRGSLAGSWAGAEQAQRFIDERINPQMPTVPDDDGELPDNTHRLNSVRSAVDWHMSPLDQRVPVAAGHKQIAEMKEASKALGLSEKVSAGDVAALKGSQARVTDEKLQPYVEMAQRSGTTLPDVVERWVAAEQKLETNPRESLSWLGDRYDVPVRQWAEWANAFDRDPRGTFVALAQQLGIDPRSLT